MSWYLAGPMSGYPEYNAPAFRSAAKYLRETMGMEVVSPLEVDEAHGFDPATDEADDHVVYMRRDLPLVMDAEGIVLMPGWEKSRGARCELVVAQTCDRKVMALAGGPAEGWTLVGPVELEVERDPVALVPDQVPGRDGQPTTEVRVVNETTGGQKGAKPERYSLIPRKALAQVALLYGVGAAKYEAHNWRRGYAWSLSLDALDRHLSAFLEGEDYDPDMTARSRQAFGPDAPPVPHMAAVVFHALALLTYMDEHPELDDRWVSPEKASERELEGAAEALGLL